MEVNHGNDILPSLNWKIENREKKSSQKSAIYYFSLTTCVYCKKGINWLKEREVFFKWLYLDDFPLEKRQEIKIWIQKKYNLKTRMASPFVIFRRDDKDYISNGYDPEYWKAKAR